MPSWAIHLAVSQKLSKNMNKKEKEAFTLGNILPDINNGYLIPNVSKVIPHDITHYTLDHNYREVEEIENILIDYKKLYCKMKGKINDPMVYGFFSHLFTDYYWNYYTYVKKGVFKQKEIVGVYKKDKTILWGDNEQVRKVKVEDFNKFSKYLYQNCIEKIKFTDETLAEHTKQIPFVSIQSSDIMKVNQYFEEVKSKLQQEEEEYQIFTKEELEACLQENVNFVVNMINNN